MGDQQKSPFEFSIEELNRELIARCAQVPDAEKLKQIFISYSHHDKKIVNRLTVDLEKAGVKVWVDERNRNRRINFTKNRGRNIGM